MTEERLQRFGSASADGLTIVRKRKSAADGAEPEPAKPAR